MDDWEFDFKNPKKYEIISKTDEDTIMYLTYGLDQFGNEQKWIVSIPSHTDNPGCGIID